MNISKFYDKLFKGYLLISLIVIITHLNHVTPIVDEYQLKAVFLYNFSNFVVWPPNTFTNEEEPFKICILGKDPFGIILDVTVESKKLESHPIVITRVEKINDTKICHILFINRLEPARLKELFAFTKNYPILTVSDSEDFITQGGMIELSISNNQMLIRLNPDAIEWVGLNATAKLMKFVQRVQVPIPWK